MRLHSLTLTAFGSFSGRATVDFDQLSQTGIFLLHGPTGAGKTTLLDAVSFALFGTVPGSRTAGEALRSHHASGDAITEVELEVTLDGHRYRIVRRPKQQRPKLRGEGVRDHPSYATVEELVAGAWVVRASKPNEADPYLQDHLHMEADQFHQIVMLPQGDFARFLRASADERRRALEELFGTHRFTEVERWLRAQADGARRALRDADEQARRLLAAAAAVADVGPFDDDLPLTAATSWLAEHLEAARQRSQRADQLEQAGRARHVQARADLAQAVETHGRQQRHAAALLHQSQLAASSEHQAGRRARLDQARRAEPVEPLLQAVARTAAAREQATDQRRRVARALALVDPDLVDLGRELLVHHDEQLIGHLATVAELVDDERSLDDRERQLDELARRHAELAEQRQHLEAAHAATPTDRARLGDQLAAAREAAGRLDDLTVLGSQLAARHQAAVERDHLLAVVGARDHDVARLRRDALDAREQWLGLVERQLASRAAALAAELEPGDACPVCGSHDHPQLASDDGSIVTDHEVAEARACTDAAERALQVAVDATAALHQQLAAAQATAGDVSVDQVGAELTSRSAELAQAQGLAAGTAELTEELAALDERSERMAELIEQADGELVALLHDRDLLEASLDADRRRITEARAGFASLTERARSLQTLRTAIADAVEADLVLDQADLLHDEAVSAAEAEAARRGFAGLDEVGAALLDGAGLAQLVEEIEAHDRAVAETEAALADADLVEAAAAAPVDLEQVEETAHAAERQWDLASTEAAAARTVVDKLDQAGAELDQRIASLAPLADAYERARQLADLANGDDRQVEHRMRLSTYVLAARLEQVAAAASERLSRMSGGRFTIVHTDEAPDGRRKGGLGLRVVDSWTSTHRETATLSGGESFFTSLALALGVADVVSAEAGGITIDTMFIDEGFGSLDEDTLQQVLDVIDGLRAGGRTIGIVSHVADLRDRITTQLEVVKGADGSSLRTTAPARPDAIPTRFDQLTLAADHDAA